MEKTIESNEIQKKQKVSGLVERGVMPIVDADTLRAYKKKFNFFETPVIIADKMADLLDGMGRDVKLLEPSAGMGALIKAAEKQSRFPMQVDFCEVQEEFAATLDAYKRVGSDFVDYNPGAIYDGVIMNPPYKGGLAQKNVDHAWDCTKPGGRIVALVGKAGADYMDEEYMGHVFHREEIKKGFKETTVDTYIFLIVKPLEA